MKNLNILLFLICIFQFNVNGMNNFFRNQDNNKLTKTSEKPTSIYQLVKQSRYTVFEELPIEPEKNNKNSINNNSLTIIETIGLSKKDAITSTNNLSIKNPSILNLQTKFQPKHKIFSYYHPRFSKIYVDGCLLKDGRQHRCSYACTEFNNNFIKKLCDLKSEIEKPLGRSLSQKDIADLYKLSVYIIGIVQPQIENEIDSIYKQTIRTKEKELREKKTEYETDLERIKAEKNALQQKNSQYEKNLQEKKRTHAESLKQINIDHEKVLQQNNSDLERIKNDCEATLKKYEEILEQANTAQITNMAQQQKFNEILQQKEAELAKLEQQIKANSEKTKSNIETALQKYKQKLKQLKTKHSQKMERTLNDINENIEELQIEQENEHKKALEKKDRLLKEQREKFEKKPPWHRIDQRYPRLTYFFLGGLACHFALDPTPYICVGLRVLSSILRGFAYFAPKKET